MPLSRLFASGSFFTAANPAANGCGVDKTLGNFIPPFLLVAGPNLFLAAIDAAKGFVEIVSAPDEIRGTVAVVRRQLAFIHRNRSIGRGMRFGGGTAFGPALVSFGHYLATPLFTLFIESPTHVIIFRSIGAAIVR